ncbi:FAD-dependent monooxygenase [Paenarthrobacter aurescens]|uniref:Monooxygenase n=1 Tax=Paenarthrobacter aurescens TaxID=43663 RepID=A0A4Y3NIT3_PAEAU|nr:FAD-dependent monooxygenase [Paenarthrobacter aurescens]MDO6143754.1 FAD-dependent monooxygenase [Paenarthrobacter aurescens]MDO6147602.1 FAD-dependent monooxygenase [Paenarthrobacter aurescens]MDO6158845.1 FAD-dependent monooxygenase [Paenarthrobacter aurescens]MDO6162829.1 FAD-dependent monooxygenase [Paenarthrobacter aurescens]GEB21153.1 monooxygenase [Paenarthrobacter aurescens]
MEKVDIIGGGIAGLALAGILDPGRFEVTIYEQRPELPTVGTTLAMWPEAQEALSELGILGAVRSRGAMIRTGALRSPSGEPMLSMEGEGLLGVSRPALLERLDAAVPGSVRRVVGRVEQLPGGAGLTVGADGVNSVVRSNLRGRHSAARPTPFLAVRGVIPGTPHPQDIGEYWARGQIFGLAPAGGGSNWYASFRSDLGPDKVDVADALEVTRSRYANHSRAVREVLAAATPENSLAQRIWICPPLTRYSQGNMVLLGDAAHAMTPNLGRGACEALIDAVTLGKLLNRLPKEKALAAYGRKRVMRTQLLRFASSLMGRVALAQSAQPVRDALVKQVGNRLSRARERAETSK